MSRLKVLIVNYKACESNFDLLPFQSSRFLPLAIAPQTSASLGPRIGSGVDFQTAPLARPSAAWRVAAKSRRVGPVGDADQWQGAVVEQLVGQRAPRGPHVGLGVVALEAVRVVHAVATVEDAAACHVQLVVDHGGTVVDSPLLQVLALDKLVGLGVVCDHPPGESLRDKLEVTMKNKSLSNRSEAAQRAQLLTDTFFRFNHD